MGDDILISTNSGTDGQCFKVCKLAYETRSVDFDVKLVPGRPSKRNAFIPAHKLFLKSCPYFQNIFNRANPKGKSKAGVPLRIPVVDVDQETLEVIVRFIYIGEFVINKENITKILQASNLLELDNVGAQIKNSLDGTRINRDNWLLCLRFATFESGVQLHEEIFDYLRSTCSEMLESESFLSIDFNEFKWLTSSRVFPNYELHERAKYKWYGKDTSGRKKFLEELISLQFDGSLPTTNPKTEDSAWAEPQPSTSARVGVLSNEFAIKPEMNNSMIESSFTGPLPHDTSQEQDPNISSTSNMEDEGIDNNSDRILVPTVNPDAADESNLQLNNIEDVKWGKYATIWGEIVPGEFCFAKYSDGYYYSGKIVESRINGDWLIEYGDGVRCPASESWILPIRVLGVDTECWYFPSENYQLKENIEPLQCKIIGQNIAENIECTKYTVQIEGREGLKYCQREYLLLWRDVGKKLTEEMKAMIRTPRSKTPHLRLTNVIRNQKRKRTPTERYTQDPDIRIKLEVVKRRKLNDGTPKAICSTSYKSTPSASSSKKIKKERKPIKSNEVWVKKEELKTFNSKKKMTRYTT